MFESRVRAIPVADPEFSRSAAEALSRVLADTAPGDVARRLAEALRDLYPKIEVEPMHPLAALPGDGQVWYAYRDGRPAVGASPIQGEIKQLQEADARRRAATPSTDPYHEAAEDVERISRDIFLDARHEEREAEDAAAEEEKTG